MGVVTQMKAQRRAKAGKQAKTNKRKQKRGHYIPYPEVARIKQKFVEGQSIRGIARETGRCVTTVMKIVKEADVQQMVTGLREKWYGAMDEILLAAITHVKESKDGGWLAYEMLKDGGVIPKAASQKLQVELSRKPDDETEESAVKRIATALVEGAIERHKFFGMPLADADDVEEAINQKSREKVAIGGGK